MSEEVMEAIEATEELIITNDEFEDFDFEDFDFEEEDESVEEFTAEENVNLAEVVDTSINDAFDKAESKVTVDTVEDDKAEDDTSPTIKASVSPRVDKKSPKGKTKAKVSKKAKVDYAHPQFTKRKASESFLKDEDVINITAEFKLDDVVITLVVKKSKTVKAFICDETSYLNACDVNDDVTTITLEAESKFDERAALDIIRKANIKYDLGVKTVSPKGDNINTRTLGLKVTRALNEVLKVKVETV